MIAIPAIDLRDGLCVQWVGGRPEAERVALPDPLAVAHRWWEAGFQWLHVVDLDAALGHGSNAEWTEALSKETPAKVQVGGGLRTDEAVERVLAAGADRAIVGTRAVDDLEWLGRIASRFPGQIVLAADVRAGNVVRRGWTEGSSWSLLDLLGEVAGLPLAGALVTDVDREGRMEGINTESTTGLLESASTPVWISGGVTTMEDLDVLSRLGAAGAVLGMALYTDQLDPLTVAARYGAGQDQTS